MRRTSALLCLDIGDEIRSLLCPKRSCATTGCLVLAASYVRPMFRHTLTTVVVQETVVLTSRFCLLIMFVDSPRAHHGYCAGNDIVAISFCLLLMSRVSPHILTTPVVQETIVSTSGKGGNHAFVTLRADLAKPGNQERERAPTSPAATTVEWPGGKQEQSDWLGDYLLAQAVDGGRARGGGDQPRNNGPDFALTFLAYLRHQRDWLRAIERARSPREGVATESAVAVGVNSALVAVTEAVRAAGEEVEGDAGGRDRLVTARRWQKFAES